MQAVCPFFFLSLTLSTSQSEKLTRTSGSSLSESDFALTFSLVSASCPQVCGHEKGHIWMHLSCSSSHERRSAHEEEKRQANEQREENRESEIRKGKLALLLFKSAVYWCSFLGLFTVALAVKRN